MAQFLKMHGLGNDFVIFDARDGALPLSPAQAVKIADRRLGIGCDTVAIIGPGNAAADATVRFINADGSDSDSCGNASRCIADVLMEERGLASVRLMTGAGMVICSRAPGGLVTVDMGAPRLAWNDRSPMATRPPNFIDRCSTCRMKSFEEGVAFISRGPPW